MLRKLALAGVATATTAVGLYIGLEPFAAVIKRG